MLTRIKFISKRKKQELIFSAFALLLGFAGSSCEKNYYHDTVNNQNNQNPSTIIKSVTYNGKPVVLENNTYKVYAEVKNCSSSTSFDKNKLLVQTVSANDKVEVIGGPAIWFISVSSKNGLNSYNTTYSLTYTTLAESIVDDYILVNTKEILQSIGKCEAFPWDGKYKQTADIDLFSVSNFEPIALFSGTYNGNKKQIKGLKINRSSQKDNGVGLFSSANNARFENINLVAVDVKGYSFVGGLVGSMGKSTVIANCSVTGVVTGVDLFVGGFVGSMMGNSTISNSYAGTVVTGKGTVGGLIGSMTESNIENSYAVSTVTGDAFFVGGFLGTMLRSNVKNCYVLSVVGVTNSTASFYGGFVGNIKESAIVNSYQSAVILSGSQFQINASPNGVKPIGINGQEQSQFIGWDFNTVWVSFSGSGFPYLQNVGA
jgi:hypothetical protein